MTLIDVNSLKQQLNLEGITYDYSDEDLQLLLTNTINELIGYTNLPITPRNLKQIVKDFNSDRVELDYYPVTRITTLKIGSNTVEEDDYVLDEGLGVLYFDTVLRGLLVVEYVHGLGDDTIDNIVNPLIFDMLKYRLTTNFTTEGVMSSVKEGDVSVNYDTSTSLGNLIYSRINDLKSRYYSVRIKVI